MSEIVLITSDGSTVCQPYVVNKVVPQKVGLSGFTDAEQSELPLASEQSDSS